DLYKEAATPYEWHQPIFDRCREKGLICFSTPFDAAAVDFLESLAAPAYKIASFENVDLPLIAKAASTGKPLIISTGMATVAEMATLVTETQRAWEGLGQVSYGPIPAEQKSLQFRRSLYVTEDLSAGTRLSTANVRAIRPGSGLPPKFLGQAIGRAVARAVKR